MSFQAGDLLEAVPPATCDKDIYLLIAVLHGFDDDACIIALRNLAKGCADTGAIIALLEMVMPDHRPTWQAHRSTCRCSWARAAGKGRWRNGSGCLRKAV